MIDIALCFHDPDGLYYRSAATTIISVLENTKETLCFHIVHDDTLPQNKQSELTNIVERHVQKIEFHSAPIVSEEIIAATPERFGRGALYRLFLHQLISYADKVIYLDCDVICEMDIAELFAQDLETMPLGAVVDTWMGEHNQAHIQAIGIKPALYFNSGVLLLNMAWFREHGDAMLQLMSQELRSGKKIIFPVQTMMNTFFIKSGYKILYLDERFNYMLGFDGRTMKNFSVYKNKILHLTGEKPWKKFSNAALFYWKYYNKTPWANDVFENIIDTTPEEKVDLIYFFLRAHKNNMRRLRRFREYKTLGLWKCIKKRLMSEQADQRT